MSRIQTVSYTHLDVYKRQDRHNRTFKLQSDVPQAEQRLLIALGRELPKPHESYYPRLWEVPSTFAPRVLKAFQNLGIVVD